MSGQQVAGNIYTKAPTDPLVNGGTYTCPGRNGELVEGIILGVTRGKDARGLPLVEGNLYTFKGGPIPLHVVEGTTSFVGWTLVAAPAKSAAEFLKTAHTKTKTKVEAAAA